MALSIGIVGLPNVGKSTLFNALTANNVLAANYPFATIEPNTGIVAVPDPRIQKLADLYSPSGSSGASRLDAVQGADEQWTEPYTKYGEGAAQSATPQSAKSAGGVTSSASQQAGAARRPKVVPATVTFIDIAGLVAGASKGEGLGNQFLAHIRSCNAICQVVRAFSDDNIIRHSATDGPKRDAEIVNTELILADLQTLQKRIPNIEKEVKADPKLKPSLEILQTARAILDSGVPLFKEFNHSKPENQILIDLQLLSMKPVIYVFNVDEATLQNQAKQQEFSSLVAPAKALFICAKLENELRELDETDAIELLRSYGQNKSGLIQLIQAAYETLGLQSYLTAGPKEVRAWTIKKGASAPEAAGVIHGDFERGFIAAQIVNYDDLISLGSISAAKAAGKLRTEGKDYVMQEGDVVDFRFNV